MKTQSKSSKPAKSKASTKAPPAKKTTPAKPKAIGAKSRATLDKPKVKPVKPKAKVIKTKPKPQKTKSKPAKPKTPALAMRDQGEFPTAREFARQSLAQRQLKSSKARGIEATKKAQNGDAVQEIESKLSNVMVPLKGAPGVCGPFQIAKYIVTMGEWNATAAWAKKKKIYKELEIIDASEKSGQTGKNYPRRDLSLREAAMWCNAKSEQEKLQPCYYLDGKVFRSGLSVSGKKFLEWRPEKNGYRLPTLMEWRFAYGSHDEKFFTHLKGFVAEFSVGTDAFYNVGEKKSAGNKNGICDLTKLVRQWVWDFYIDLVEEDEFSSALGTSNHMEPDFDALTTGNYSHGAVGFRLARNAK